jgi:hypothetical protein
MVNHRAGLVYMGPLDAQPLIYGDCANEARPLATMLAATGVARFPQLFLM